MSKVFVKWIPKSQNVDQKQVNASRSFNFLDPLVTMEPQYIL